MAATHGLLAGSRWQGARLRQMVEDELSAYGSGNACNIGSSGDDIMLSPKAALPFTLVLHELAANAAKYGALSTSTGRVRRQLGAGGRRWRPGSDMAGTSWTSGSAAHAARARFGDHRTEHPTRTWWLVRAHVRSGWRRLHHHHSIMPCRFARRRDSR